MHVQLFDHHRETISRIVKVESGDGNLNENADSRFSHYFGGAAESYGITFSNLENPCQVVLMLDTTDPLVPFSLPGMRYMPLVHGFNYSSNGFEFVYRFVEPNRIEVMLPKNRYHNPDFPYENYPPHFAQQKIGFQQQPFDICDPNDALQYQGVFGLEHLDVSEMEQVVRLAKSTWRDNPFEDPLDDDESDIDIVKRLGRSPFMQCAPTPRCENTDCSAEIESVFDDMVFRKPTLQVIAVHEPSANDELLWGMGHVQLIFQLCSECHCITVTNQCT